MISEDRVQLNNRFIKVFQMLQDRGDIVLNDRAGKGMGDFAERILGNKAYGHIVRAFLNSDDKRTIDYHHIKALCKEYNVNEQYMLYGAGTPFGFDFPDSDATTTGSESGNILFTSIRAFAGNQVAANSREDNSFFSIPGVGGNQMVAFPISGNSMEPVIADGDIVICKEVGNISEIKDNEIYAVRKDGEVWVKYVQRIMDSKRKVTKLKLISANYLEHDPFEKEVNESMQLFKVIKKISNL